MPLSPRIYSLRIKLAFVNINAFSYLCLITLNIGRASSASLERDGNSYNTMNIGVSMAVSYLSH